MEVLLEHKSRQLVRLLTRLHGHTRHLGSRKAGNAVRQQRGRNHRFHIVRNAIKRSGAHIAIQGGIVPDGEKHYAFVVEGGGDLFYLPSLGYAGPEEVHNIWSSVVRDIMTESVIRKMLQEMEGRLATKSDLEALKTDMKGAFPTVGARLTAAEGTLGKIDGHLVKIDGRLDKADGHFVKLATTLDGLDHYVRENLPPKP